MQRQVWPLKAIRRKRHIRPTCTVRTRWVPEGLAVCLRVVPDSRCLRIRHRPLTSNHRRSRSSIHHTRPRVTRRVRSTRERMGHRHPCRDRHHLPGHSRPSKVHPGVVDLRHHIHHPVAIPGNTVCLIMWVPVVHLHRIRSTLRISIHISHQVPGDHRTHKPDRVEPVRAM